MIKFKRWLWGGVAVAVALTSTGVGFTAWQFAHYAPKDAPQSPDPAALAFFLDDYAGARKAFLAQGDGLAARYRGVERFALRVPAAKSAAEPFIDGLYIPAQVAPRRLLLVTSGVHGVEGPTGSAVQRMFMKEFLTPEALAETGVLLVHAVNPWGFANGRRFTENNVDLNRNASTGDALYRSVNAGYPTVSPMINPVGPADTGALGNVFFPLRAVALIAEHGMPTLRQAVLQGQYQAPKGIYFGGRALEPALQALAPVLQPILAAYPLAMTVDLHTGYGARGALHLLFDPPKDAGRRALLEQAFAGQRIDWTTGSDFYTVTGDVVGWVGAMKEAAGGVHLPAVFEYGTMDSQTTLGAIKSLHVTLMENQGFQHGYASAADEARIKHDYREMFYPFLARLAAEGDARQPRHVRHGDGELAQAQRALSLRPGGGRGRTQRLAGRQRITGAW